VDEFRTAVETAFRQKARDYFRGLADDERSATPAKPETIWHDIGRVSGGSLAERLAIIEEAASHDPKLGSELLCRSAISGETARAEERICRFGWLAGSAAHVLEAGTRAARERGAFASSLMGCREVQESLAGIASAAELLRLGTCRILRLLERGERDRADAESAHLEAQALALARDLRAVALALLGEAWVGAHLPGEDHPSDGERKTR
jgi:hypothetical protein